MFNRNLILKNEKRFNKPGKITNFIQENVLSNLADIQNISIKSCLNISASNIYIENSLPAMGILVENCAIQQAPSGENFDCAMALNVMQKIHPLRSFLAEINAKLRDNGLFFGTLYGSDSLIQVCNSLYRSYEINKMPFINHFLPVVDIYSIGSLMQACGFGNIVINLEKYPVKYGNIYECLGNIRAVGGANVLENKVSLPIKRQILRTANEIFLSQYSGICEYVVLFIFAQKQENVKKKVIT